MAGISELRWMVEWAEAAARRGPAASQPDIREVTPSRHDFHQAITSGRGSLAVIAEYAVCSPDEGQLPKGLGLGAWLEGCYRSDVAALALSSDHRFGTTEDALRTAREVELPLLHHQPCLSKQDVVRSRLLGADAVWTHAALSPALEEILQAAKSFHMTAVVEVADEAQEKACLAAGARTLCFSGFDDAGALDLDPALELAKQVPPQTTLILRGPVSNAPTLEMLRGKLDAIWICGPSMVLLSEQSGLAELVHAAEGS